MASIPIILTVLCLLACALPAPVYPTKVAVIGAGLAGLTSAYRLQSLGFSVEVYEARSRPGGRVCTAYFGPYYEELGGKNINDGGDAESLRALMSELGLKENLQEIPDVRLFVLWGQPVLSHDVPDLGPEPTDAALEQLKEQIPLVNTLSDLLDGFFGPTGLAREMSEMFVSAWEGSPSAMLCPECVEWAFWRNYRWTYEAAKKAREGKPGIVPMSTIEGGSSVLVDALTASLNGHIHYLSPLTAISRSSDGRILLKVGDSDIVTDTVILAIPCSTLRDVVIEPGLFPDDQFHAIQTTQYGTNAKIIYPVKVREDNPAELVITKDSFSWLDSHHALMTCYYGGQAGVFDSSTLKRKVDEELQLLAKARPGIEFPAGTTPVASIEKAWAKYESPVAISWITEPYSKGSYMNFGIGQWDMLNEKSFAYGEEVKKAFRPINGQIFFAGEHTSLAAPGSMDGAVESGERTARMVREESGFRNQESEEGPAGY